MEQRPKYAAMKDAPTTLREEEFASSMGQKSNDAVLMDVQI